MGTEHFKHDVRNINGVSNWRGRRAHSRRVNGHERERLD